MSTLMHEYFRSQLEYERKYGPKTVVLTEVGIFYEVYEIDFHLVPNEWWDESELIPEHIRKEREVLNRQSTNSNTLFENEIPKIGKVTEITGIINCFKRKRNKECDYSLSNCYTLGFNIVGGDAKIELLKWNGYSVAIFNQTEVMGANKRLERELVTVARRQLDTISASSEVSKKIVTIYLQCFKTNKSLEEIELLSGVAYYDLETGENGISEMYSKKDDPLKCLQDLYRYLISIRPKEVYIHIKNISEKRHDEYTDFISRYLELYNFPFARCIYDQVPSNYLKIGFQNSALTDIFFPITRSAVPPTNKVSNISLSMPNGITLSLNKSMSTSYIVETQSIAKLGLERFPNGIVSYLLLLDYCRDISADLLTKVETPSVTWMDSDETLILTHNAIFQLDIFGSDTFNTPSLESSKPLIDVIDRTSTPMGRRYLHSRLIAPRTSANELNSIYDSTESLITNTSALTSIISELKSVGDLSKLKRSLTSSKITPKSLERIVTSCLSLSKIGGIIELAQLKVLMAKIPVEKMSSMSRCLNYIISNVSMSMISSSSLSYLNETRSDKALIFPWKDIGNVSILTSPLNPSNDFYRSFAVYEGNISHLRNIITTLVTDLNNMLSNSGIAKGKTKGPPVKFERKVNKSKSARGHADDLMIIVKPKSKATALTQLFSSATGSTAPLVAGATFIHRSTGSILSSPQIEGTLKLLNEQLDAYYRLSYTLYKHLIESLIADNFLDPLITFVTELDFVCSSARNAIENRYYRPNIIERNKDDSCFLEVREMRHPIVERNKIHKFIANDISIGNGIGSRSLSTLNEEEERTLGSPYCACIRGPNTAGKTTLTKSVALIILLAQAGYFVPGHLTFTPYHRIITRLSGNDNLRQGLSSFQVEGIELRIILKNADHQTLVLGDELCRGTEVFTATAMTICAIKELAKRHVSFIFSTHLFDLSTYPEIISMKSSELTIYHLTSHFDKNTGLLIQDRVLKEGVGPIKYGIDVARSLGLPSDFLDKVEIVSKEVERRKIYKEETVSSSDSVNSTLSTVPSSKYNSSLALLSCILCGSKDNLETHHMEEQKYADKDGYIGIMHKNTKDNMVVICKSCHDKTTYGTQVIKQENTGGVSILTVTHK